MQYLFINKYYAYIIWGGILQNALLNISIILCLITIVD